MSEIGGFSEIPRSKCSGLLLRHAMNRAHAKDEILAANPNDATFREYSTEDLHCLGILRMPKDGRQDHSIRNVEICIRGWQATFIGADGIWHRQSADLERMTLRIAHGLESFQVFLEGLIILVPRILLQHRDDVIGGGEARDIVHVPIGVVSRDSIPQPKYLRHAEIFAEQFLDLNFA